MFSARFTLRRFKLALLDRQNNIQHKIQRFRTPVAPTQSLGAVEYTDCISAQGYNPPPTHHMCPGLDIKQSDGEASVMLELSGMLCTSLLPFWGCPRGVMVKAMNCGIVVREFVLQSRYYVHFRANTLGKGMNPLILPPAMGK